VPRPTPTAGAVEEQVVVEPQVTSVPSVEIQEELPDLASLNEGGYLTDVFFDTDRYDLKEEVREILAQNTAWLQQYPSVRILVEGHCDERNTREYNLALGERRANAVRDYMVFLGTTPERIQTISYGEERPFAEGKHEEAWRLNRRTHFVIIAR
jgi:peptidoglycan-associated lipoprotein